MMYANRADGSQPDLRSGFGGQRDSYYEQQPGYGGGYGTSAPNGRRAWPRMSSEPQYGSSARQQNPHDYPIPSNHRSYETVTTASGSGSLGEPAGYQTDPTSSDNSSIDRVPRRQPEPVINDYGIGFGQSPSYQPPSFAAGLPGASSPAMNGGGVNGYHQAGPPVPPHKGSAPVLRKPITAGVMHQQAPQRPAQPEKRKSWFARRFSKQG